MPKYLFEATYVGQGIKGLMQEGGTKRRDALAEALKSVGGSLESFYYAFRPKPEYVRAVLQLGAIQESSPPFQIGTPK